jgi:hypothetical protein
MWRRAMMPLSHSLEVEAGILTGQMSLYDCAGPCDATFIVEESPNRLDTQLAIPYFGVRYVYYRWARSMRAQFRTTQRFQVAVDALIRPFNQPPAGLANYQGDPIKRHPIGGRIAFRFPSIGCRGVCVSMDLAVGYFPSPAAWAIQASTAFF